MATVREGDHGSQADHVNRHSTGAKKALIAAEGDHTYWPFGWETIERFGGRRDRSRQAGARLPVPSRAVNAESFSCIIHGANPEDAHPPGSAPAPGMAPGREGDHRSRMRSCKTPGRRGTTESRESPTGPADGARAVLGAAATGAATEAPGQFIGSRATHTPLANLAEPFELDLDVFRTEGARHAWGGGNAHVDAS